MKAPSVWSPARVASELRSIPAQNTGPLPRTSTDRTWESAALSKASPRASKSSRLSAFRFSARLRVISRTPESTWVRTRSTLMAVLLRDRSKGWVVRRGASGVAREFDGAGTGPQAIVDQQPSAEKLAHAQDRLPRLGRLQPADHRCHRPQDARLGAGRDGGGIRLGAEEAPVARSPGHHGRQLAPVLKDGGVDQRHPGADTGVVEGELDREIVGRVADDIEATDHAVGLSGQ